jgi:hypothetical protein
MSAQVYECQCPECIQSKDHPGWQLHHQMNLFLSRLNEQLRRWFAALESKKVGRGGDSLLVQITGMDVETIRRGRRQLDEELVNRPIEGVRQEGGWRLPVEKKDSQIQKALVKLIEGETAGDPLSDQKWQRSS